MTIDTAVIPCGGLGRRLMPMTRWLPKELLPVGLKPSLYWALDEAVDAGIHNVVLVVNPHKPMVEAAARQYLGPLSIEFVPQPKPQGLGDALLLCRDILEGQPFAVLFADHLFMGRGGTHAVLDAWRTFRKPTVLVNDPMGPMPVGVTRRARIRKGEDGQYHVRAVGRRNDEGLQQKDGAMEAVAVGRFVYPGDVFDRLAAEDRRLGADGELSDLALLRKLAEADELRAVMTNSQVFDIGTPEGYRTAVSAFPAVA
ncbi:MAG: sugar phosphate nucleotidyltransferase [Gemmatimonadales bacterium]|nr:sugar phosphate nucleotidyltransferase [Gemmatimonadales bacterium]